METYSFEGKTTEEAVENACRELNLSRDEINIEIIEPGSAGIFGLVGSKKAKISVSPAIEYPEAIEDEKGLEIAKEALEQILALIPVEDSKVNAEQKDEIINLEINGDKSGLLIGRKGRTLDALQFIVNKIVNKEMDKRTQVVIDSENYRQRRKDYLIQMAVSMGEKAKRIRKPVATNLLNPHDRRIVHLALREDSQLGTKSRGEGVLKKIVIIPKKSWNSKSARAN